MGKVTPQLCHIDQVPVTAEHLSIAHSHSIILPGRRGSLPFSFRVVTHPCLISSESPTFFISRLLHFLTQTLILHNFFLTLCSLLIFPSLHYALPRCLLFSSSTMSFRTWYWSPLCYYSSPVTPSHISLLSIWILRFDCSFSLSPSPSPYMVFLD